MAKVQPSKVFGAGLLLVGVMVISLNLRSPITGIGPLLELMREQLQLSVTQAGLLTTLPLLAFAFCSPLAAILGRRQGLEVSLMVALVLMLIGIIMRSMGSVSALMLGTVIIGAGIAIANVLLPSLLKRDFPSKVATITALYVLMMGLGSTISAGIAVPMADLADSLAIRFIPNWAFALGSIIVFPIVAIILWLPQLGKSTKPSTDKAEIESHSYVWRSAIAWQVTAFLALNSLLNYIFISWLPSILIDFGFTPAKAGFIHGVLQLFSALPAIILIPLMAKIDDKRLLTFALTLLVSIGLIGLLIHPEWALVWAMMFGFGTGGGFILGLSFISYRTQDAHQAASLSGMAQCLGYLLAATGPIIMGSLHEWAGSWLLPLGFCLLCCVLWSTMALFAARKSLLSPVKAESQPNDSALGQCAASE